ncbi:rhombosortase [Aliidiomarina celeris]|uniref:rhombosortase n=1 Tax=Aliidiomarina celeris TaxID=2249428 RepID=UPI000DEA46B4|nr:rhombosortase [Aliidiomarina celeris]
MNRLLHGMKPLPHYLNTTALIISVLAVVFFFVPASTFDAEQLLALNSLYIFEQPWRIFTTHLLHINEMHLLFNLLGLWLLVILFREKIPGRTLLNVVLISALFATLSSVYIGNDASFIGLSGVLHGIFAYGAIQMLHSERRFAFLLIVALVAKLVWDMLNAGENVAWLDHSTVAYWCHLGGALGGVIAVPALKKKPKEILNKK